MDQILRKLTSGKDEVADTYKGEQLKNEGRVPTVTGSREEEVRGKERNNLFLLDPPTQSYNLILRTSMGDNSICIFQMRTLRLKEVKSLVWVTEWNGISTQRFYSKAHNIVILGASWGTGLSFLSL